MCSGLVTVSFQMFFFLWKWAVAAKGQLMSLVKEVVASTWPGHLFWFGFPPLRINRKKKDLISHKPKRNPPQDRKKRVVEFRIL